MQKNVAVFGTLRFPPESMGAVRPHLKTFVDATRSQDDCIAYDVAEDLFDPGLIRFSELWPDNASLDAHLVAPHIAPWREAAKRLGLMERAFTAYDIHGSRPV
ncbi:MULTISPECIES: putative quinol monooxygenase [Alcanivorax]|uniref:putative quinol monooxygenase n=1 Tax=Alcanivorax TaxID=59753 RepID=UPI0025C32ABB|nr:MULTISPECIES: putative quinol monooxygenase [Alcanivorax]